MFLRKHHLFQQGIYHYSEIVLYKKYSDKEDKKELFKLNFSHDRLYGTWQNNNHSLKVELTPTTKNINDFKWDNIHFIRDSICTYGTKRTSLVYGKKSKKSLFRLGNGFAKQQREYINPKLDSIHTRFAETSFECEWVDINIKVEFITDEYVSFNVYSSVYCGGAHPSYNTIGYNFDLKNKIQIDKVTDIYSHLNLYQALENKYENNADLQTECKYFASDNNDVWEYCS